jgi:quercetin dioxygenase-like cupin family protein
MDDERLLLAVPALILLVAGGAVVLGDGGVRLIDLLPGALALSLFAAAMYGLARYRGVGPGAGGEGSAAPSDLLGDGAGGTNGEAEGKNAKREEPETDGPAPFVRRHADVTYEGVGAADGLRKGVLVGEGDGAPNLAIRRFVLAPGASVPRHTNEVEHEQYVLEGRYTVGIGDAEHEVGPGDSVFIPAGTVHWYRNDGPDQGAFICAVPTGDDRIELVE